MKVNDEVVPKPIQDRLEALGIPSFRPAQEKAIQNGLFDGDNLLICTPTASGKTLVGEMGMLRAVEHGKAVYIVPLRALASEKYKDFSERYPDLTIDLATGDVDQGGAYLSRSDIIIATSEKLDSLLRHKPGWVGQIRCVVVDEIHLLHDEYRGPTLEVVLTILRKVRPDTQIIGLSATVGNASEVAEWLDASLVEDSWRPVELREGVFFDGVVEFDE